MEHFFALTFGAEEQAHQRRKGSYDRYEHTRSAAPPPPRRGAGGAAVGPRGGPPTGWGGWGGG